MILDIIKEHGDSEVYQTTEENKSVLQKIIPFILT